ncbi:MAG TPA: hypothetical protein VFV38_29665 [Ktedonobacteraceae bacterium]|nr:hypothetical protein [Ktedonobacteraceae bacterium]
MQPLFQVNLFYPTIKDELAANIETLFNQKMEDSNFREQAKQFRLSLPHTFLYTLGHRGRGLDDFSEVSIQTTEPLEISSMEVREVEIPLSHLLNQIADAANTSIKRRQESEKYRRDINMLRFLASQTQEIQVKLPLRSVGKNMYGLEGSVTSMRTVYLSEKKRHRANEEKWKNLSKRAEERR